MRKGEGRRQKRRGGEETERERKGISRGTDKTDTKTEGNNRKLKNTKKVDGGKKIGDILQRI